MNRTYNDIAQALSSYPGLSPRTDVHSMSPGLTGCWLPMCAIANPRLLYFVPSFC